MEIAKEDMLQEQEIEATESMAGLLKLVAEPPSKHFVVPSEAVRAVKSRLPSLEALPSLMITTIIAGWESWKSEELVAGRVPSRWDGDGDE